MYQSKITGIGNLALDFLEENMLILFGDKAPEALAEISILHTLEAFDGKIEPGDRILLANQVFEITAVGQAVNRTFAELGHLTLSFTGKGQANLPGNLEVSKENLDKLRLNLGDRIEITKEK